MGNVNMYIYIRCLDKACIIALGCLPDVYSSLSWVESGGSEFDNELSPSSLLLSQLLLLGGGGRLWDEAV